ncbi:MAG: TetR/AcrR family transcriptional regulator [Acidobacteria bacterium]|nr:TetR/AcrR family transcriptional regulator [Acidobacteriota bacterium]
MAFAKVSDEDLICALTDVFRTHGYEGASLSQIATATGLEKASLYHRFPGGKEDMVAAVVNHMNRWFQERVFTPLEGPGKPAQKIRLIAKHLREFYGDGNKSCVLDTLSLPGGSVALRHNVAAALQAWIQAFAGIAREAGASRAEARERAEQAIVEIEGSLVLTRVLGDRRPFHRTMERLPELLVPGKERVGSPGKTRTCNPSVNSRSG